MNRFWLRSLYGIAWSLLGAFSAPEGERFVCYGVFLLLAFIQWDLMQICKAIEDKEKREEEKQ